MSILSTLTSLSGVPGLEAGVSLLTATYKEIQNVKLYKQQCQDMNARVVQLLLAIRESSRGLEGTSVIEIADELDPVIHRINRQVKDWGKWSRLKSLLQQREIKDGIDRLNRDLDGAMMKFSVQINMEMNRGQLDLRAIQERDNAEIREVLQLIVKSQDDMKTLLMQSPESTAVEEVMESLQTHLMDSDLQPKQEEIFKAGLWMLHENTARLPPLTDLSGQITLTQQEAVMTGSSNDIFQGQWLDREPVALRLPRALETSPEVQNRFEREVAIWRELDHENVVPLYGIVYIRDALYSVSPWMDNGTILTYVKKFPSVDRLKLLTEIASGTHLPPFMWTPPSHHTYYRARANVLVSRIGVARLSDFGLSKFLEDCDKNLVPSNSASIRWTAPEVLKQDGVVSKYSDVWSFAMVCLEILSGEPPFNGKDPDAVQRQLEHGKHPDRPGRMAHGLSNEVWDLMRKCWSKNPDARPSMINVRVALLELRGLGSPGMDRKPSTSPSLQRLSLFGTRKNTGSRPSTADSGISIMSAPPSYRTKLQKSPTSARPELPPMIFEESVYQHDARKNSDSSWNSAVIEPKRSPSLLYSPLSPITPNSSTSSGFANHGNGLSGGLPFGGPSRVEADHTPISSSLPPRFGSNLHNRYLSADNNGAFPSRRSSHSSAGGIQHMSPIQEATRNPNRIFHAIDGAVSSGTMEGLVDFLIVNFNSRKYRDYCEAFMTACSDFTTPEDLFGVLSRRFQDAETDLEITTEERVGIQYNIFMIITSWLESGEFPPTSELLWEMRFFCERAIKLKSSMTMADKAKDLQNLIDEQIKGNAHPVKSPLEPKVRMMQSSELKPRDLAIAMTLLEGDTYSALRPSDYMLSLTKSASDCVNAFSETNNKIKSWVTDSILHYEVLEQRAEVLKFFIFTALECRKLRNFSSLAAIVAALHSKPVENLKLTRKALTMQLQGRLDGLYDIADPEANHRGYREAVNSAPTAQERDVCIPWLPIHLKELRKVLQLYPVTVQVGGYNLINCQRYVKFMDRIGEVLHYVPPDLEKYRSGGQLAYLQNQLRNFQMSDDTDDQLLARSLKFMTKEASDYRTRRPQLRQLGFRV